MFTWVGNVAIFLMLMVFDFVLSVVSFDRATIIIMVKEIDMQSNTIDRWHQLIESKDPSGLSDILADDVVFHSPVVHTPQEGKTITTMYLTAAFHVLIQGEFSYLREVISGNNAVLEFETELNGIHINGVDMIQWNDEGKICDFKVMIRPLKAVNMLHQMMGAMLKG